MATVSYGASTAMTVTNLHSLASSATAGWGSAEVDNTSDLYFDAHVTVVLDPANTTPANSKAFFVYAYGGVDTGMGTTGATSGGSAGSEGALTFPDITTGPNNLRLIGTIHYVVADVAQEKTFSVAKAFGGVLPAYWGVALVNHSGAALAASGNTVKWRGIKTA